MEPLIKLLEVLTKVAKYSDKLVPLILSIAVLAAIIFNGLQGSSP